MLYPLHRHHSFTFIFLFFIGGLLACNYTRQGDKESESLVRKDMADNSITNEHDGSFLMQCGSANLKLMQLAKLAASRSGSEDVKALAAEVNDTHKALYDEANELALQKSISLPSLLTESDKLELEKIEVVKAEDFDRKFCEVLMREQNYMQEAAQRFSDDAKDSDVRAFARIFSARVNELNEKVSRVSKTINA